MGRAIIRYGAAFALLIYGFAKINGSQFTILDSELDKPMGHVSGFWLTWYFFGFSKFYGSFLALAQIAGALLLTFRRTVLIGACVLAPILANIVIIDIAYGIDMSATLVAILLLCIVVGILAERRRVLLDFFWNSEAKAPAAVSTRASSVKWAVRIAMIAGAFSLTWWTANYNNRDPTPIDGVWQVVHVEPDQAAGKIPQEIFFEYNRAYMCVFKFAGDTYVTHHFQVDAASHSLGIWQKWLRKEGRIFLGSYVLNGPTLKLQGQMTGAGAVVIQLEKRKVRLSD